MKPKPSIRPPKRVDSSAGAIVRNARKVCAVPSEHLRCPQAKRAGPVAASVVDLFCGVGGLSHGFKKEGLDIAAGIDVDEECRYPFEFNNGAPFLRADVSRLNARQVSALFVPATTKILVGCAPCQPFSIYNQKNSDPRWQLLEEFSRIITEVGPAIVSMENVPSLVRFREGSVFKAFLRKLERDGYEVSWSIVRAADYGVPQSRQRLVLLASKFGPIELEAPRYEEDAHITVRQAIGKLRRLTAGGVDRSDPLHRCSTLSEINERRMKASKAGGTWHDWHTRLVTTCHKKTTGKGYSSVYGRMSWDLPAPTITTQFFGFGNGRFGHPQQDRAISLREGAILQSFPPKYRFVAPGQQVRLKTVGRLIGNAVPVELARAVARSIKRHLREYA